MEVRVLKAENNSQTNHLYKEVFSEDSDTFVKYYYDEVASRNKIYVIEDKCMLHLNPYTLCANDKSFDSNYIVAVATKEKYRKQGLMRRVLTEALKDMSVQGNPITFLMPAAEAIYTPYDFVVVAEQELYEEVSILDTDNNITSRDAMITDVESLSCLYMNSMADNSGIYIKREADYFLRMIKEQAAQKGAIRVFHLGEKMVASYMYTNENNYTVRDIVAIPGISVSKKVKDKYKMMARILNFKAYLEMAPNSLDALGDIKEFVVTDDIINENNGHYLLEEKGGIRYTKKISENLDLCELKRRGVKIYNIGELTQILLTHINIVLNEIV